MGDEVIAQMAKIEAAVVEGARRRKMPRQKPGESKQDYGTPDDFMQAVEKRFGAMAWDLAATWKNAVCTDFYGYQQSGVFRDSLKQDWSALTGNLWLNPPFGHIAPWAKKCRDSTRRAVGEPVIFFLTPASVGANWFWDYVWGNALVLPLHPRLTFKGTPVNPKTGKIDPYPKDLCLSVFGVTPGMKRWVWR
jgi:phage N-6-adenine-methyltransferase